MNRILIVEDQRNPLLVLRQAVKRVIPAWQCDVASCYADAKEAVRNNYNVVLLDHRMPIDNVGNLEREDFNAFSDACQGCGYKLIPEIERVNPETLVIGTSSLSDFEGIKHPEYHVRKDWDNAEADLAGILSEKKML